MHIQWSFPLCPFQVSSNLQLYKYTAHLVWKSAWPFICLKPNTVTWWHTVFPMLWKIVWCSHLLFPCDPILYTSFSSSFTGNLRIFDVSHCFYVVIVLLYDFLKLGAAAHTWREHTTGPYRITYVQRLGAGLSVLYGVTWEHFSSFSPSTKTSFKQWVYTHHQLLADTFTVAFRTLR